MKIKRTFYNFAKTLEKLEKKLEELGKLENALRIEKQSNASFFKNLSKVIENYVAYKQHLEKQMQFQVENKLRQFDNRSNSFLDIFDDILFLSTAFHSFVKEKWLSFKLDRSIKQLHAFTEENYKKEKYALVFEYLQDKVDEKTIKYYFTSKEVDFINVVKKTFKGQALSKEEITFIKTFANENDNQKNRKLLFDLTSLNLKYNLKHKTATVKL